MLSRAHLFRRSCRTLTGGLTHTAAYRTPGIANKKTVGLAGSEVEDTALLSSGELPTLTQWRKMFPMKGAAQRVTLSNAATAVKVAEAFIPSGSRGKTIIEGYPGTHFFSVHSCMLDTNVF